MMFKCQQCGKPGPENARFCPHCGKPSEETLRHQTVKFFTQFQDLPDIGSIKKDQVFDERYRIVLRGNDITFSSVFQVIDLQDRKTKRLVIIPPLLYQNPEAMDFLLQEYKSKLWLNAPEIIRTYSIQDTGTFKYIICEYFRGRNLQELKFAAPEHKLPEKMVLDIAVQIASALEYAHNYNVLAGLLYPESILINKVGKVKLDQFGMADVMFNALNIVINVSSVKSRIYLSPEQLSGKMSTTQSDVYIFGIVLYELLTGRPPFYSGDVYQQIQEKRPDDIDHISTDLNLLIQKCLLKDPSKRFHEFSEVKTRLEDIRSRQRVSETVESGPAAETEPHKAPAISMPDDSPFSIAGIKALWGKLNRVYRIAVLAVIPLLAVIILLVTLHGSHDEPERAIDHSPEMEAWSKISPEERQRLTMLLNEGDSLLRLGHLTTPMDENALDRFHDVLQIYPHENRAREKLNYIKQDFIERAMNRISQGRFFAAESVLLDGLSYFPGDSALINLTEKNIKRKHRYLMDRSFAIEILNGAGVSGIAGQLATVLEKRRLPVFNTDNYIENGTINWDVRESFIINRWGQNHRIDELADLIGIKTITVDTTHTAASGAEISIVLGKDYQRLPAFR